ncbi:MAG: hypothetical protein EHM35_15820 [Planctomycetaceae bacterium]|nr:MAG: hypothetical protein EHM35_15820 [Planctomycetaceae bacterium]
MEDETQTTEEDRIQLAKNCLDSSREAINAGQYKVASILAQCAIAHALIAVAERMERPEIRVQNFHASMPTFEPSGFFRGDK